jgi:hypothetical protein
VEFDDNSGLPSVPLALRDLQEAADSRPNNRLSMRARSVSPNPAERTVTFEGDDNSDRYVLVCCCC